MTVQEKEEHHPPIYNQGKRWEYTLSDISKREVIERLDHSTECSLEHRKYSYTYVLKQTGKVVRIKTNPDNSKLVLEVESPHQGPLWGTECILREIFPTLRPLEYSQK